MAKSVQDRIAQLESWGLKIRELSERVLKSGDKVRFDDLHSLDELRALHAIAQAKLDALRADAGPKRSHLEAEVRNAWNELAAAFERHRDGRQED